MHPTLQLVLILLASMVLVVALFRSLRLPVVLAYLLIGIVIGPHVLGWIPESPQTRYLAEFGVVFLMFAIGLEFSFPRLMSMRAIVFGLGGLQVLVTLLITLAAAVAVGLDWQAGVVLGAAAAMSSTAIVSKMLAERGELHAAHGRQVIGVLLFQDLAVVPFLVLIPALATNHDQLALTLTLGLALAKGLGLLILVLFIGQRVVRPWFHQVARRKSPELFMINVLLVVLGLAYLTSLAGLSLALGAFLAGMLISETEYRYQVEADIRPFHDILLGLFFVTVGMQLDPAEVVKNLPQVLALLLLLSIGKALLVAFLTRATGHEMRIALRTGLYLGQAGEFGFVLLTQAGGLNQVGTAAAQPFFAAMLLSMLVAPFLIQGSGRIAKRFLRAERRGQAEDLHAISRRVGELTGHVILCGYGRTGQNLARFLEREKIPFVALDIDTQRVQAAAQAGESVVYGDASRREVLLAAGLGRARAVVVTYADTPSAMKILYQVQELRPELPVVVRTLDDSDLDRLKEAGAAEVIPEVLEGSLMLASHTLALLGVPWTRVLKQLREVRGERYGLIRGFFRGATDEEAKDPFQPRLHSLFLDEKAAAVGKRIRDLDLESLGVKITAVRRRHVRHTSPDPDLKLQKGDVVIVLGEPAALASVEARLLHG